MRKFLTTTTALAVALIALPANALTYVGSRTVQTGTAQLSITTDDTLGGLAVGNVIDWTIEIFNGTQAFTLRGPLSGNNSRFAMINSDLDEPDASNSPLHATATELAFNFDGNATLIFQLGPPFDSQPAYCLDGDTPNLSCGGENELLFLGFDASPAILSEARSGIVTLASVATPGVPEPASWALMIAGFGLVGGAMRRRDGVRVAFA